MEREVELTLWTQTHPDVRRHGETQELSTLTAPYFELMFSTEGLGDWISTFLQHLPLSGIRVASLAEEDIRFHWQPISLERVAEVMPSLEELTVKYNFKYDDIPMNERSDNSP